MNRPGPVKTIFDGFFLKQLDIYKLEFYKKKTCIFALKVSYKVLNKIS